MSEIYSENLNRFNGIIESLPLRLRLTISSLCLLDNVSTQLLRLLILNSNSPQVIAILTDPTAYLSSGETEIFQTLLKLFKQIRMVYNTRTPLLNVHDVAPGLWFPNSPPPLLLRGHEAYIITAIRKANLLTFLLTVLGCFNYGFELLQDTFLDIFCPNTMFTGNSSIDQNGKFLKSQAILFLDLKTQAFISGLKEFENGIDEVPTMKQQELLDMIFASNLADQLVLRRTGVSNGDSGDIMTPSEREFIERCDRRRENLLQYTSFKNLVQDYDWSHFVKELLDYCHKNMGLIIWGRKGRGKSPLYSFDSSEFDPQVLYASGAAASDETSNSATSTATSNTIINSTLTTNNVTPNNSLLNSQPENSSFDSSDLTSAVSQQDILSQRNKNNAPSTNQITKSIADAAVAVTVNHSMGAGNIVKKLKPKRTWSKDEEEALIEGLKEVGPSWSKILDLYGPGGKITEALKNRTQVQLKDKARNWKLQYLKTGRPLPEYLLKVTGTLERSYRSKKKVNQDAGLTQDRETSAASQLFGAATADTSGFDPNLEANM